MSDKMEKTHRFGKTARLKYGQKINYNHPPKPKVYPENILCKKCRETCSLIEGYCLSCWNEKRSTEAIRRMASAISMKKE